MLFFMAFYMKYFLETETMLQWNFSNVALVSCAFLLRRNGTSVLPQTDFGWYTDENRTESHGDTACKFNYHGMGKILEPQMKLGDLQLTLKWSSVYTSSFTSSFWWLESLKNHTQNMLEKLFPGLELVSLPHFLHDF